MRIKPMPPRAMWAFSHRYKAINIPRIIKEARELGAWAVSVKLCWTQHYVFIHRDVFDAVAGKFWCGIDFDEDPCLPAAFYLNAAGGLQSNYGNTNIQYGNEYWHAGKVLDPKVWEELTVEIQRHLRRKYRVEVECF